jgi:hypothetical protein
MMKHEDVEDKGAQVLTSTLSKVPFFETIEVRRSPDAGYRGADLVMHVKSPDGDVVMLVEAKTSGEPRLAREAVNQLLRYKTALADSYAVFLAPYISPKAAEVCREAGVGYMDLAGNCLLAFGTVYIERQGNPNPAIEKRGLRTLYSPKATRVLRVLLQDPQRQWKLQALAEEAQVSIGQVHKVKSVLTDREWVQLEPDGMSLSKPAELLAEWATNYTYRRNRIREYYSLKPPGELENDLAEACAKQGVRYALAGFSAAARLAPFVRYQRASAYLDEASVTQIAEDLNLKEVSSGANVTLWVPYDEYVWHGSEQKDNARVTSPIQTFLDLKSAPGRGEEAADFLLKEVIKLQW